MACDFKGDGEVANLSQACEHSNTLIPQPNLIIPASKITIIYLFIYFILFQPSWDAW